MTKLHQILAVENTAKRRAHDVLTQVHHSLGRAPLLGGLSRVYTPKDEGGEERPPEMTKVQFRSDEGVDSVREVLTRLFDVTFTKELANTEAKADVVVDGQTLLLEAPVTYLLFLEKQLTDLRTFFREMPTLDPADDWDWSDEAGVFRTPPVVTISHKKVPRNHRLAEATKEHPEQVQMYMEDVPVGSWSTVKFSGAQPKTRVDGWVRRVETLLEAVKSARAEANGTTVTDGHVAAVLFDYILTDPGQD